jgi:small-conductance mechanosensitive channel
MDIQHNINPDLNKRFSQEGIKFAYPTQTLYVTRKEDGKTMV